MGIYAEYLDRNLTFDELAAEREKQLADAVGTARLPPGTPASVSYAGEPAIDIEVIEPIDDEPTVKTAVVPSPLPELAAGAGPVSFELLDEPTQKSRTVPSSPPLPSAAPAEMPLAMTTSTALPPLAAPPRIVAPPLAAARPMASDLPTVPNAIRPLASDESTGRMLAAPRAPAPLPTAPPAPLLATAPATLPATRPAALPAALPAGPPEALLEGQLERDTGPALLMGVFAQELTGRLTVKDGPAAGTLYFYRGEPVWADDPQGDAGLHRRLLQRGRLKPDITLERVPQGQLLGSRISLG